MTPPPPASPRPATPAAPRPAGGRRARRGALAAAATGLALAAGGIGAALAGAPARPGAWAAVLLLVGLLAVGTARALGRHRALRAALDAARAEAGARLAALERASRLDALTGLHNRQAFGTALVGLLDARAPGAEVAVIGVDLDGFKPLNDTHGHAAGDAVLAALGARLAALAGAGGVAGRLGGDELALAVPAPGGARGALDLARRLIAEVERPVPHEGLALRVGGSVGLALSAAEGGGAALADRLIAEADEAMLLAKARTRATGDSAPVLHDRRGRPPRRAEAERERLAAALALGEVVPRYVPIRHLGTGETTGYKAEPVWEGPAGGGLAGAALHGRVEELGLQGALLSAMATPVLRDLDALLAEGLDPGRVTLRLPEMALATPGGRRDLDRLLAAHPACRTRLEVAVPGDALADRAADRVRDGLAHLRAMGLDIAVTGFGTGRASFHHLGLVDFDELRIDASFVGRLGRDRVAQVAAEAIAATARALGARLVAEGVETEDQRERLLALGCLHGRGPAVGPALDLRGLRARLVAQAGRAGPPGPLAAALAAAAPPPPVPPATRRG